MFCSFYYLIQELWQSKSTKINNTVNKYTFRYTILTSNYSLKIYQLKTVLSL